MSGTSSFGFSRPWEVGRRTRRSTPSGGNGRPWGSTAARHAPARGVRTDVRCEGIGAVASAAVSAPDHPHGNAHDAVQMPEPAKGGGGHPGPRRTRGWQVDPPSGEPVRSLSCFG